VAIPQHKPSRLNVSGLRSHLLEDARGRSAGFVLVGLIVVVLVFLRSQELIPFTWSAQLMFLPVLLAGYFFGLAGWLLVALLGAAIVGLLGSVPASNAVSDGWLGWLSTYAVVGGTSTALLGSVDRRRRKVIGTQISTLKSFAVAVETEDETAGEHCERVAANACALGEALGLGRLEIEELYWAGLLHDIGKVTVPREILRKPGGLTLEEYLVMRRHARLGANLLGSIDSFHRVAEAVGAHHERWDGSGYPGGLRDDQIPLFGRILAVVDVFEALSSDRPYRRALSRHEALEELRRGAGTLFDPLLVDTYVRLFNEGRIQSASQPQDGTEQPRLELDLRHHTSSGPS
jgi:putative nucleotidyltransferase with HDIG domain